MKCAVAIRISLVMFFMGGALSAQPLEKISLRLLWKHQFEFAGFYIAQQKGFYKEQGLDVNIKEYQEGVNITQEVLSLESTYGVGYPSLVMDRANGADIVLLDALYQSSPHVLLSLKSSGITSIKDFKGKKVMMREDAVRTASLFGMFYAQRVYDSDLILVEPTFRIDDLLEGKVDATTAYLSNELYELDQAGVAYDIWNPKAYGFDFYNDFLFTSADEVKHHSPRVQKFRDATRRGWLYAFSHIPETIMLISQHYNSQHKSPEALVYEAKALKKLALHEGVPWGEITRAKIGRIHDLYRLMGLVKAYVNLDQFIYRLEDREKESKAEEEPYEIVLTKKEKTYLKNHQVVTMCNDPSWEPIEFAQEGNMSKMDGIAIDILRKMEPMLSVTFQNIPTKNWTESQDFLRKKKCDILPSVVKTEARKKYAKFTKSYLHFPLAIFTTREKPIISDVDQVIDQTWTRKKGSGLIAQMKKEYPRTKVIETNTAVEALQYVSSGKAYFTLAILPVAAKMISDYQLNNLQIAGYTGMRYELSIAVRNDDDVLLGILDKALESIPRHQIKSIVSKWVKPHLKEQVTDYTLVWRLVGMSLLVIAIILFFMMRQRYLNREISQLNKELENRVEEAIIEAQKKEKLLQHQSRLAQMGEMLSMIAHQWRQPLASISSLSTALELQVCTKQLESEVVLDNARKISEYSQHLSHTIDDFRNFFKPNKEKRSISYEILVDETLRIIGISVENKRIRLVKDFQSDFVFYTHANELKQVLLNLIKNAEDALLENGISDPHITIETRENILRVRDNAGGISSEIIEKIFNPYFSTKIKKDGTGLGLYMSKIIIEEHCAGELDVYNTADGAVFEIRLPSENN